MSFWSKSRGGVRLRIHVQPRSSRAGVFGLHDGKLRVRVTAAPAGGAANRAVIDVLARWLGVPKRVLALVRGGGSKEKTVEVQTEDAEGLVRRLAELMDGE